MLFYVVYCAIIVHRDNKSQIYDPKNEKKASEIQIGGDHYKKLKISPLDFILANNLSYCLGQVVKYICRDKDNKIEDLLKAKHYIDLELEKSSQSDKKGKKLVD